MYAGYLAPPITDLVQIRRLGEQKHDENLRFRKWMKSHVWVERQFHKAAEEIHDQIDCRQCASCCREPEVELTPKDIEKLAKFLGISRSRFLKEYTTTSTEPNDDLRVGDPKLPKRLEAWRKQREQQELEADAPLILRKTETGCVFLSGNDCLVYEARPADCERFPHLLRGPGSLQSRMWSMIGRATYCPIVYNWIETVKGLTNFRG